MHSNPRRRALAAFIGTAAAAAVVLSGCTTGGNEPSSDGSSTIDTIRGAWITDPTTFDPALVSGMDDYRAARLGFDTVLRRDDDGVVGGLAESYESTPTGVLLQMRDDITCGDGSPLTPTAVAASLQRLADPETGSTTAPLIFGGGAVTVTGDDETGTVSVDLESPYSELAIGLTVPAAGIVCPAGLDDLEGLAAGDVEAAFSGPYVLTGSTSGVGYTYELRDGYDAWPQYAEPLEGVPAETLSFAVGVSDSAANQLATGELEMAQVTVQDLPRFESGPYEVHTVNVGDFFLIFNETETSPFADPALRLAAAQAIDPEGFRQAVNPNAELLLSAGDPDLQCVNIDESLLVESDPDAAAQVLDGVRVRLIGSNAIGVNGAGNVYVQERLRAAGAEVELANVDNGTWITTILGPDTGAWDITMFATINNVGTLVTGLSRVLGPSLEDGGRNIARSDNAEASEAYSAALAASTDEEKCGAYQTAQAAVLEAVDLIPLTTNPSTIVTSEQVTLRSPGGREDLSNLRIVG